MPMIKYKTHNFQKKSLDLISQVNDIVKTYAAQGYNLSLRQIFYQLVSRNTLPNTQKNYKSLGTTLKDAREAGLVDWLAIEDRTRDLRTLSHWNNPEDIIKSAAQSYHINLWQGQSYYLEVWIEKDAGISIIEQAANKYDTPCFSCRGFTSASEMWQTAQRIKRHCDAGQKAILLHLGDHDPSGADMTRDIEERLTRYGAKVEIVRIALTIDQIRRFNLPKNPVKKSDTRAKGYIKQYGDSSWELDALEPRFLDELVTTNILKYLDMGMYKEMEEQQEEERQYLYGLLS